MPLYRAQAVFQGGSNLPEDRFINTFHFRSAADHATAAGLIATNVRAFYEAGGASSVGAYLLDYVARSYQVKVYDMDDPEPRQPLTTVGTLPTYPSGVTPLPEEVAICCSFRADTPYTARRRGRIFLGPLNNGVLTAGSTAEPARVSTAARSRLNTAMQALAASTAVQWVVYSRTDGTDWNVTNGWVDNAFDTQRRRGVKASTRSAWALP